MNTITLKLKNIREVLSIVDTIEELNISKLITIKEDLLTSLNIYQLNKIFDNGDFLIINFRPTDVILYTEKYNHEDKCNYVSKSHFVTTLTLFHKYCVLTNEFDYAFLNGVVKVINDKERESLTEALTSIGLFEYPPEVKRYADKTYTGLFINTKHTFNTLPKKFYFNDDSVCFERSRRFGALELVELIDILKYIGIDFSSDEEAQC
jgi:hypothetical protein